MLRRGIPDDAVEHVLTHYDTRRPALPRVNAKPAEIYIGRYEGRSLKVYVEIGSTPPKVKTVAWSR
jgi:hypothetical protein